MTVQTLGRLVRARYRLQWAKVRGSALNTGIFLAAQGLVLLFVLATASSGLAGAAVAVHLGQAESAARTMLVAVFLNALVASVLLGFGMTQVFSDALMRRYPLTRPERFAARQLLALFEPLWLFTAALYLGAAIGFRVMGAAPLWRTLPAALLLLAVNYLLARFLVTLIDRVVAFPAGQIALFLLFNILVQSPIILRSLGRSEEIRDRLTLMYTGTPPVAAAVMMGGAITTWQPILLAGWLLLIGGALLLLESRPTRSRSNGGAVQLAEGTLDRIASVFPALHPPLVSKTLRCFLRNPRVRLNLLVLPLLGLYLLRRGGPADTATVFGPLVASALVGSLLTFDFDANMLGYDSLGTRRLLLVPVRMSAVLRALSATSLLFGLSLAFVAIAVWSFFFPALADSRVLALMLCSALSGSMVVRGVGLWTTVLLPCATDYGGFFGKQRRTGAGIHLVMFGTVALAIAIGVATRGIEWNSLIRVWWVAPIAALLCGGFYIACLEGAGRLLAQRRERVLAIVEGRG